MTLEELFSQMFGLFIGIIFGYVAGRIHSVILRLEVLEGIREKTRGFRRKKKKERELKEA